MIMIFLILKNLFHLDQGDENVVHFAQQIKPSARGELEITAVIDSYLKDGKLSFRALEENTAWMDCGTVDSLNEAANYIKEIEKKMNFKIGCVEQIALDSGWLSVDQYLELVKTLGKNEYTRYLLNKIIT
mgnify:CR=1 FL=1